jgi:ketosteroid isomerase-like protein
MDRFVPSFGAVVLVLTVGCGESRVETPEAGLGMMEAWKAELIQADEVFAATVGTEGLSVWGSFFTSDGAMVQAGVGEIRGVGEVQALMDATDSAGGISLFTWAPTRAEVSTAGDLGYTVGNYRTVATGPDGVEMESTGTYVSIWRRQADGGWKVEMDLGNPITPPTPVS